MALYEEDALESLVRHLRTTPYTVKDASGAAELVTDTLPNLFPNIQIKPVGAFDDIESVQPPLIGVAWEDNLAARVPFFGESATYQHVIRLVVIGTVMSLSESGDLVPNKDASVFQTMQLRNAMRNYYRQDRYVPWVRVTYDAVGTVVPFGVFVLRGNPQIMDIDATHFVVILSPEVLDE